MDQILRKWKLLGPSYEVRTTSNYYIRLGVIRLVVSSRIAFLMLDPKAELSIRR